MTDYNDGEWHGWNGGECPVHPETVVECLTKKQGVILQCTARTKGWWSGRYNPILAFRVINEHKEPREFWVSENDGFAHKTLEGALRDQLTAKHGYVHVREVIE